MKWVVSGPDDMDSSADDASDTQGPLVYRLFDCIEVADRSRNSLIIMYHVSLCTDRPYCIQI